MRSVRLPTLMIASVLAASALFSCNKKDAPEPEPEPTSPQAQQQASSPMPAARGNMMQQLRTGCPMVVERADVAASETEGGVALTFTTAGDDADDLRTRVQHMAEMYETHRGQRGMMWHHMGGERRGHGGPGMGHMAERGPMPAVTAIVTKVDKGARLELRPTDASQLTALREHVRGHQQRMASGECWMLQGQAAGTPGGEQD